MCEIEKMINDRLYTRICDDRRDLAALYLTSRLSKSKVVGKILCIDVPPPRETESSLEISWGILGKVVERLYAKVPVILILTVTEYTVVKMEPS